MDLTLLDNRLIVALVGVVVGMALSFLTQRVLNKRGLFTYFVRHDRVGLSTDDAVFGTVRVTWNGNPVTNLYLSTVELQNKSLNDYEDVVVRVFANDTDLLTERSQIVGTTHILEWTEEFSNKLVVKNGEQATQPQLSLYRSQRDYRIPTMNRGQVVRLAFLNAASAGKEPSLWLDILHKGVRLKFQVAQRIFMGVPMPAASLIGSALGVAFLPIVIWFKDTVWIAAVLCFAYGLVVLVPGALTIRFWRWLRDSFGS